MRIVDVCAFYSPWGGGVRTYVDAKLRWASRLGHELVVIVPSESSKVVEIAPGALLAGIPSPPMLFDRRYRYFNDVARLHHELDKWCPDHVECSSPWSSASAVARWQGSATRALFMHSDPMAAYAYRWLAFLKPRTVDMFFSRFWQHLRFLGRSFDTVISPSNQLSDRLRERGLGNVATIPLGVDEGFSPANRDPALRRDLLGQLGLAPTSTLLLSVGRLGPEKRTDLVARAVARASQDRDVGLVVVGEGSMRRKLEHLALESGRIKLLGHIGDRRCLARMTASADAVVHGCEAETFGLVIAEAIASDTAVIVPDRGGAFEQGATSGGISYAAGNVAALQQAIVRFIDSNASGSGARDGGTAGTRLMHHHFRDLFACYEDLRCSPLPEAA